MQILFSEDFKVPVISENLKIYVLELEKLKIFKTSKNEKLERALTFLQIFQRF